jgi:catechol 2,3-dioxygenase-like lactoylglutathione lyase family enzyme
MNLKTRTATVLPNVAWADLSTEDLMPPKLDRLLESALYVDDPALSARFYQRLFGFEVITAGERMQALSIESRQVLLLFKKGASARLTSPPPHDGDGHLHLAFAIPAAELDAWENWLTQNGVAIEEKHTWERGGCSLYFRDPDQHLVEVATPGVWSIY